MFDALKTLFPAGGPPSITSEIESDAPPAAIVDEVAAAEADKYRRMWDVDDYRKGSPGYRALPQILEHLPIAKSDVVGDFGCGSGRAALAMREAGCRVRMVDIAENCLNDDVRAALLPGFLDFETGCLWSLPETFEPVDWAICCDVLEHIPESHVDAVLDALAANMRKGGFLAISTINDGFGQRIGETLHLTVKPVEWWRPKLQARFKIVAEIIRQADFKVVLSPKEA